MKFLICVLLALSSFTAFAEGAGDAKVQTGSAENKEEKQPEVTIKDLYKEEESLLQRHHPFYFAYGSNLSKLQVSFKTPLIRDVPLYFGYTQFMFWAIGEKSAPFRDLTYNPELFYRWDLKNVGVFKSIDIGAWEHNSNGKAGADSRSFDSQYVRFNLEKTGKRWTTRVSTQLSGMHGFDDSNKDIQKYLGPLSFSLSFVQLFDSWVDKSEISLQASPGGKFADHWDYGGYQLSWSFRVGRNVLIPAFYLQYYRGFAETLLNYNKRIDQFRVGVVF